MRVPAGSARLRTAIGLTLVLALGAGLRARGLDNGTEYDLFVNDEIFETKRALELLRGDFDFNRSFKGFYFYPLSVVYAVYGVGLVAIGRVESFGDFIATSIVHPGRVVLLSRLLTFALGTALIYLLYLLGRRLLPARPWMPPVLLALGWATCSQAVWYSKWGMVETCAVFLSVLSFFPISRIAEGGTRRDYWLAGMLIAAATATKGYAVLLAPAVVVLHVWKRGWDGGETSVAPRDRWLLETLAAFLVTLAVLDPSAVFWALDRLGIVKKSADMILDPVPPSRHLDFYLNVIAWNVGALAVPFAGIGLWMAFRRGARAVLAAGGVVGVFLLSLGLLPTSYLVYSRYMLIPLAFVFLVTTYGVATLGEVLARRGRRWRAAENGLALLVATYLTWNGLENLWRSPLFHGEYVPVEALVVDWFEQNVPEGALVAMSGGEGIWPGHQTVPLFDLAEDYVEKYEEAGAGLRPRKDRDVLMDLARADDVRRYDLLTVEMYNEWQPVAAYLEQGVEYFVIDPYLFSPEHPGRRSVTGKTAKVRFYNELRSSPRVQLVARYRGNTLQGGDRTIEIFRVVDFEPMRD